jgi:hypothetical protein
MPPGVQRSNSSGPPDTANGQYVSGNFIQTLGKEGGTCGVCKRPA